MASSSSLSETPWNRKDKDKDKDNFKNTLYDWPLKIEKMMASSSSLSKTPWDRKDKDKDKYYIKNNLKKRPLKIEKMMASSSSLSETPWDSASNPIAKVSLTPISSSSSWKGWNYICQKFNDDCDVYDIADDDNIMVCKFKTWLPLASNKVSSFALPHKTTTTMYIPYHHHDDDDDDDDIRWIWTN